MRTLVALAWLSITFAFCVGFVAAQNRPRKPIPVETQKPFDANEYEDWKKVEFDKFSFYVPKEFKLEKRDGIDAISWVFESDNFIFIISSGSFVQTGPLISDQKRPNYQEKFVRIGNVLVRQWFYEDKEPPEPFINHPYLGMIAFNDPSTKGYKHGISLFSKEPNGFEVLEKMLASIKFK